MRAGCCKGILLKGYWKLLGQLSVHRLLKEELLHAFYAFDGISLSNCASNAESARMRGKQKPQNSMI
jgi:hypothetical protein